MADWATISALSTAGGTLVLAAATFASVRSAHRAARATERALLAGIKPLLVPSRFEDLPEKVGFADDHWVRVQGGRAVVEVGEESIYLAMALRNVGSGIAVLDRWDLFPERATSERAHRDPQTFRRLTRDIYVAAIGTSTGPTRVERHPAAYSGVWHTASMLLPSGSLTNAP